MTADPRRTAAGNLIDDRLALGIWDLRRDHAARNMASEPDPAEDQNDPERA
jgi:hypothetical protein